MTNLVDFDRALGGFLEDGPNTAPEAPVIAALAHARTSPRRPDPFGPLRRDVMSGPWRPLGLRPALVVGLLALLAAGVAVAVGSRPSEQQSVIPPTPTPTPSAVSSGAPQPSTFTADVPLVLAGGNPFTLSVRDTTGELIGAVSGQPGDGASVEGVAIAGDPADPRALIVTWVDLPCATGGAMTVDERAHSIRIVTQGCGGDAIGFDHVVRLTFTQTADAAAWSGTTATGPQASVPTSGQASATTGGPDQPLGSPAVPPIHVALIGSSGNPTSVDVVDESGLLTAAVSGPPSEGASVDVFDATNDTAASLRLTWPGSPCDTVHRLTIDATLSELTLDRPECAGDSIGIDRTILLTFSRPVDARTLGTSLYSGRGGVDMPNWTAAAPDSAGNRYDLTLADPGRFVDSLEGSFDPGVEATGAGPTGIRLVRADDVTLRLIWLGPSCATAPALSIEPAGDRWHLVGGSCASSGAKVLRMVDVVLHDAGGPIPTVDSVVGVP